MKRSIYAPYINYWFVKLYLPIGYAECKFVKLNLS